MTRYTRVYVYSWFFCIDRRECDKMLMLPSNPRGTFLVRSSSDKSSMALSVLDFANDRRTPVIKHYRIRKLDNGGCYISAKKLFPNLRELIEYYKSKCLSRRCW